MENKEEVRNIPLAVIKVGERARKDLGDIDDLTDSINRFGLLQPILVDSEMNLVAGERRLRSCANLGLMEIQAIVLDESTSDLDIMHIELEENLRRKQMTWQESSKQAAKIEAIESARNTTTPSGLVAGSTRHLADVLGISKSQAAADVNMGKALEMFPELEKAKSRSDAEKSLNKLMEQVAVQELMRRKEKQARTIPAAEQAVLLVDSYIVGDALEGLIEMSRDDEQYVIAEVDPPYAIDIHKQKHGGADKDYKEIDIEEYAEFLASTAAGVYKVLAPNAYCVWWYGQQHYALVLDTLRNIGFTVDPIPSVWAKAQGQNNQPKKWFSKGYETFLVAMKGRPTMFKQGRLNIFEYKGVAPQKKIHDTERPVDLIKEIIGHLVTPAHGKVLCPFLGSGNTIRAAHALGMGCIGWDIAGENTKAQFSDRIFAETGADAHLK